MKSSNTKYVVGAMIIGVVAVGIVTLTVLNTFKIQDKVSTGDLVSVGGQLVDVSTPDTGNYKVDLSDEENQGTEKESDVFVPFKFGSGMTELFVADVEKEDTLANSFKTLTTKKSNSYSKVSKRFYKLLGKRKLIKEAHTKIEQGEGGGILTLSYGGKDFQLGIKYPEGSDGSSLEKSSPDDINVSITSAIYKDSPIEIRRDLRIFSKKHYMESLLEVICGSSTKGYINMLPLDIGTKGKTVYLVANNSEYVDLFVPFSDGTLGHVRFSDAIDLYPSNIYAMVTGLFDKKPADIMTNRVRSKKYEKNLVRSFKGKRVDVGDLEGVIAYGNIFSVGSNRLGENFNSLYREKIKSTDQKLTGSILLDLVDTEGYETGVGDYSDKILFSVPDEGCLVDDMPEIEGQGYDISAAISGIETVPMAGLTETSDYSDYTDSIHVELDLQDSKKCKFVPTNRHAAGTNRYASIYKMVKLHTGKKETVTFWYDAVTDCITDIYYVNTKTAKGKVRHMSFSYNNPVVSIDNLTTFVSMIKGEVTQSDSDWDATDALEEETTEEVTTDDKDSSDITLSPDGDDSGFNIVYEEASE